MNGSYQAAAHIFQQAGKTAPSNQPDMQKMLKEFPLDAVVITTPYVFHHDQTVACLEVGLDVLLEKPTVMNEKETHSLMHARNKTGTVLVVAFPGSLSPNIRTAVKMLRGGEIGKLLSIDTVIWQNWEALTANTWRQIPDMSGGGFLFDVVPTC